MILHKTIFIQAFHKKLWKEEVTDVLTGEVRKGLFGREKPVLEKQTEHVHVGFSDCDIDGARLASDIQTAIEDLQKEGFELVSLIPVISGNWEKSHLGHSINIENWGKRSDVSTRAGYGYGYGYSFTEGFIVILKK